jgi:hypothetical protein
MRLFEFTINDESHLSDIVEYIKTNCSQYLNEIDFKNNRKRILYRGIRYAKSNILIKQSREDRTPCDSDEQLSKMVDLGLAKKGIEARRLNSFFATSQENEAKRYGKVYSIYPINGYHYTFPNTHDLILTTSEASMLGYYGINEQFLEWASTYYNMLKKAKNNEEEFQINSHTTFDKLNYYPITNAYYYASTGMILNDFYDYMPENIAKKYPMEKILQVDIDKFIDKYNIKHDTDIVEAIDKGYEIWIKGSYVAIQENSSDFLGRIRAFLCK